MAVESSKDISLILRGKREKSLIDEEDSILFPCRKRIRRIGEEPVQIDIEKLPDSLLFEVLYRLPCRSALQYKSVSKRWYSLISHSEFVRRSIHHHHRHEFSKSHSDPFTLALYYDRNILALPFHNSEDCGGDRIDFLDFLPCIRKNYPFYIEASYNDLLLIRSEVDPNSTALQGICEYCICNPLTKQWITLPHIRLCRNRIMVGFVCDPYSCDKEQGCINNAYYRYKVVRIYPPTPTKLRLEIFSSDTGKWCDSNVIVSSPSPGYRRFNSFKMKSLRAGVVACNGKLHWLDTDAEDMIKGFLVFDPFNDAERLSYINPPIEFLPKGCVSFGVFQGHFRMFQMFRANPYHFDVWELEDYGNADTWCLKHKVYMKDLVSESSDLADIAMDIWRTVSFLAFHPTVGEIAFLQFRNYIVLCNMQTKVLKVASKLREKGKILDGNSLYFLSLPPKSTFVLGQPSWPTPVHPSPLKFE
ncbi:hypothetical protein SO802_030993 [Lithocarpus litseifolius]|uniref:F-box domain-containing protein n=1 Tax=Lithocarpus litseifolius TaxID=425828 RepID=A0AAW2BLP1_9ROSI